MSTDSDLDPDEGLRARVAALEAENATLRSSVVDEHPPHRHHRSRAVVAAVLIVLGVLLAPVAIVTGWAKLTLTDTDQFVATYAPLASDPAVQSYVVDQAMSAIDERANFDELTKDLVDGLIALGTGPRATTALQTLQSSVAEALRSQVQDGVTRFVQSDRFAAAWAESLRVAHQQITGVLRNDPAALATISPDGTLGIPLGPIVEHVKAELVDRGLTIANRIPPVDRTVPLIQSNQLPTAQLAYGTVVAVGAWLPWVVLALLAGGVAVANRRHRALLWAAGGFALALALLALGISAGRIALVAAVPASVLPGAVSTLFYDAATGAMQSTAVSAAVLGVAVAIVSWLAGPFRTPRRLRGLVLDGAARLRSLAEERGISTGPVGAWVHRHRSLLLALVAVVAGAVVVFNRPVSPSLVGWTAFWSAVAVLVLILVERPPAEADPDPLPTTVELSGSS